MFKDLLFSRITPLIKKGHKTPLNLKDFPHFDPLWNPQSYIKEFDSLKVSESQPSLLLQILKILLPQGKKLLWLMSFILFFKMVTPVLIHNLIQTVGLDAEGKVTLLDGLWMAVGLGLVQLFSAILNQHYVYHSVSSTQSAVNGLNQRIFNAIVSKGNGRGKGELINRTSSDAELAGSILWGAGELVQIVLTILLTSGLLFYYLGSIAWVPLVILTLLLPVSRFFSKNFSSIHNEIMRGRDERVGKMGQFIDGIKVIKSFVWEKAVHQDINDIRSKEVGSWRKLALVKSLSTGSYLFASLLVSFASFALYVYQGNTLTAELAFTCITLFSFLEPCFRQLPKILGEISSSSVAATRIAQVLNDHDDNEEVDNSKMLSLKNVEIFVEDKKLLENISLEVSEGESIAIVGAVGSGKTTLINTILKDLDITSGEFIQTYRNVSLVTQEPFLFQGTISKNITLSDDVPHGEALTRALHVSCLQDDLRSFPGQENFFLIENGGNLSGGQKQRVNLARAAYYDSDLIILDDPLSALDPKTEDQIIERLVMGHWGNKTRIMATQRLKHLDKFDRIIFINQGQILAQGPYEELLASCQEFHDFVRVEGRPLKSLQNSKPQEEQMKTSLVKGESSDVMNEELGQGEISLELYWDYLKAMARFSTKAFPQTLGTLLTLSLLAMIVPIFQNRLLSTWTESSELFFLFAYGGMGIVAVTMGFLQHFYWSNKAITAGESLHSRALKGILSTKMNYFDNNPSGRIINRFSRDLDAIEKDLSWSLEEAFMALLNSVGAVLVMLFAIPVMIVAVLPVLVLYWGLQKSYRSCMREAKRLVAVSRSPRFSSIQEVCAGSSIIRTYKAKKFFRTRFESALGDYQKAFFGVVLINRWFSIRIPIISSLLSFSAAIAVIMMARSGSVSSGLAGLILVYAFRFWDSLNWTVRAFGEAEGQMTSVERLNELSTLDEEESFGQSSEVRDGEIIFDNVYARYGKNLPDVLKGTSFTISAGEKVGVIGRTGAGKSTLFSLLHRFLPAHQGEIMIDNTSIEEFSLEELRGAISTIPQSPVLFSGTIRSNLDPYHEYSDQQLEEVLQRGRIHFLPNGLGTRVLEGGVNFSRGQRQLLCLARALVRKSKIIIVDEATASIDAKTDQLIRNILMNECPRITVLIIAHKMESIVECDKIIEMGDGRVLSVSDKAHSESIPA